MKSVAYLNIKALFSSPMMGERWHGDSATTSEYKNSSS